MTTPTARRSRRQAARVAQAAGIAAAAAARDRVDVLGLEAEATLATIAEARAAARSAEVVELRAVAHWADQFRITDPEQWAISGDALEMLEDLETHPETAARLTHEAGELGTEGILRLLGEGAFMVREFAVTDLAVTLAMSEQGARHYVAETVELRDRLPRFWGQVMAGRLPVWKARRVAEQTIPLKAATAGFVDAQLEQFAHQLSLTRITKCVEAAIIRCQPDLAERRAEAAAEGRGVWVEDDTTDGTTRIEATLDSPDAHAFDRALDDTADRARRTRRRIISAGAQGQGGRGARRPAVRDRPRHRRHQRDRGRTGQGQEHRRVAGVPPAPAHQLPLRKRQRRRVGVRAGDPGPGRGPALLATRPGAHRRGRALAERADPRHPGRDHPGGRPGRADRGRCLRTPRRAGPGGLRTRPRLRLPLVRPAGATYDLDHIDPYVPPDDGGPPGQTSTANTARLCRYHHRVKTHGHWRYQRTGPTAVTWTSPQGRTYTVDHTGTHTTD